MLYVVLIVFDLLSKKRKLSFVFPKPSICLVSGSFSELLFWMHSMIMIQLLSLPQSVTKFLVPVPLPPASMFFEAV